MSQSNRQAKAEERRAAQEAAGIPDSKPFIAEETAQGMSRVEACHINGVLVADLNLDPQVIAALDYWMTDEGVAEKNSRPDVREPSGIELGADPFAKALQQRRDDVKDRDFEPYEARDPLKEVADRYTAKGMRPKFLSAAKIKEYGGTGDHEVVKYPEGHVRAGEPVMVKGMVLGQMPEGRAKARNRHYQAKGGQLLQQIEESSKAQGLAVDK